MKAVVVLLAVCIFSIPLCFANPIYREHKGNTSISISESDKVYKLSATFNPDKTKQVQHYMNDAIGKDNNYSFSNTQLDATLTLDSKIKFYITSVLILVEDTQLVMI